MIIGPEILDKLTAEAKASARLRMSFDLRNSAADGSQRMLNAIEPGSVGPVHRHGRTSETVVCLRGADGKVMPVDAREGLRRTLGSFGV